MKLVQFAFVHLLAAIICLVVSIRAHSTLFRGISPEDEKHYTGEVIKCKDGSKTFLKSQLNDDFCDCLDSTDEPGTSACPRGSFFCPNAGHFPTFLHSSRVNDGICDCCDGSDEYGGIRKCPNTCWEAGKAARDKFKKKIETYRDGISLREDDIRHAQSAFLKDEADLLRLQNEEKIIKDAVAKLKEQKELIEKAEEEEKERVKKEEGEKKETEQLHFIGEHKELIEKSEEEERDRVKRKETEESLAEEKDEGGEKGAEAENAERNEDHFDDDDDNDKLGGLTDDAPSYQEETGPHENSPVEVHTDDSEAVLLRQQETAMVGDDNPDDDDVRVDSESEKQSGKTEEQASLEEDAMEGLSKEDLGRIVASRWTGKKTEEQPPESEEEAGYASDTDDDNGVDDDSKEEDEPTENHTVDSVSSQPSWLEKIQRSAHSILRAVIPFKQAVDKSDADRIRRDYDESTSKLLKLQSKISKVKNKLSQDFGANKEFYSFHGRCFEAKETKYTYKVCPFEDASQLEGHSTTRLGRWEKFEDSYGGMLFSNGDRCWNGPDRSLRVRLRCGLHNEVLDVDEPSRCEYTAVLSTPAVCVGEKLEELQHKLERMSEEQLKSRDEL